MKIIRLLLIMFLSFHGIICLAQMSNERVVEYVKKATKEGKTQSQIAKELVAKGVTEEQVLRIKQEYEQGSSSFQTADSTANEESVIRAPLKDSILKLKQKSFFVKTDPIEIFGHDIFSSSELTFEPNENIATPQNYILGPNDQLRIEVWGYNEISFTKTISPEGTISIDQLGPIQMGGLTIAQASEKLTRLLSQKYSTIDNGEKTQVSVTLGQIRTICVNVMGEVNLPGTFRLSPFSTVFTALHKCGGLTNLGSLRSIKVIRKGKQVGDVDVYGYLFKGESDTDITLEEGDIIIVPPYVSLVSVTGKVKRPVKYELRQNETLSTLLEYTGGFKGDAYTEDFFVSRYNGIDKEVHTVKKSESDCFRMQDGDSVNVMSLLERFSNRVEIRGAVVRPGTYQIQNDMSTVGQLVKVAGGLLEDAFTNRMLIIREKPNLELETVSVDLGALLGGNAPDVELMKNDVLIIYRNDEVKDNGTLTIVGYVSSPGNFLFSENTSIEDLILLAGGLLDGASMSRVDISRRIKDNKGMNSGDAISQVFSFPISEDLKIEGSSSFKLMPYDIVIVRKSPSYQEQQLVTLSGEFNFTGTYALTHRGERVSELVKRAGGYTEYANLKGASIVRQSNEADRFINNSMIRLTQINKDVNDSISVGKLDLNTYQLALNLDKALKNPGSTDDIIVYPDDVILLPKQQNTVRVTGDVMFPVAVPFVENENYRFYVEQAGGFATNAKKNKTILIYPNGLARKGKTANITPGCVIVVPSKGKQKKMSTADILSLASTTSSVATSIAALSSLIKK